jgi:hypothetical protein
MRDVEVVVAYVRTEESSASGPESVNRTALAEIRYRSKTMTGISGAKLCKELEPSA